MGKLSFYLFFINIVIFTLILLPKYLKFKESNYKLSSGNSFFKTIFDKGNYGEFLTFSYLEKLDTFKSLLTNVYIPKRDGTTTEIDLIMLSPTGIYVFESKNYSGWIFGKENSRYWTQTLESRQKNKFFNPIWQNKGHITALKNLLDIDEDNMYKSYIIFSERCKLKKLEVNSTDVKIIKRNDLLKAIKEDIKNSPTIINADRLLEIYSKLNKYSNVDESIKVKHIKDVKENMGIDN